MGLKCIITRDSHTTKKVAALLYHYRQASADKFMFLFFQISTRAAQMDHIRTAEHKMTKR
jgi:hypothetical protein